MSPDSVADMRMKGKSEINDASNIQGRGADKDGWSDDEREAGTTCAFRESRPRFVSTNEALSSNGFGLGLDWGLDFGDFRK